MSPLTEQNYPIDSASVRSLSWRAAGGVSITSSHRLRLVGSDHKDRPQVVPGAVIVSIGLYPIHAPTKGERSRAGRNASDVRKDGVAQVRRLIVLTLWV